LTDEALLPFALPRTVVEVNRRINGGRTCARVGYGSKFVAAVTRFLAAEHSSCPRPH